MARVCCLPVLDARSPTSGGQQAVLPPAAVGEGPSCPFQLLGASGAPRRVVTALHSLRHRPSPRVRVSSTFVSDWDTGHWSQDLP